MKMGRWRPSQRPRTKFSSGWHFSGRLAPASVFAREIGNVGAGRRHEAASIDGWIGAAPK
jgi:hypothetical protein